MTGWFEFLLALSVFLLSHAIPTRPPVRPWLISRLGRRGYFIGYSLFSLAVLGWLIVAAARAPYVEVIPPWPLLRWVPVAIMPIVCVLAAAGMAVANPLSFGGMGRKPFDPDHPGILAISRHPILLALLLWAMAHLIANGSLAHVILFGLFVVFAWMGMWIIDRRKQREMGPEMWQAQARHTAWLSLRVQKLPGPIWIWGAALLAYVALLHLHEIVIGVSPFP